MRTQKYLHVKENREDIPIMPPDMALCLHSLARTTPCLEHIFMVQRCSSHGRSTVIPTVPSFTETRLYCVSWKSPPRKYCRNSGTMY